MKDSVESIIRVHPAEGRVRVSETEDGLGEISWMKHEKQKVNNIFKLQYKR